MAGQPIKPVRIHEEEYSWVLYFSFSSWLILSLFFFTGVYKEIILSADRKYETHDEKLKITHVLIDQELENNAPSLQKKAFIGDQNNQASGKITDLKGFESMSQSNEMRFSRGSENQKNTAENPSKAEKKMQDALGNQFDVKIVTSLQDGSMNEQTTQKANLPEIAKDNSKASIPGNYEFKKQFVFSWDNNGMPVIPTIYEKNYKYFKNILDKIHNNWSPPGGMPYPTFDSAFNSQGFVPGRSTYQTFPDQDVQIVFSIDSSGNVTETKLWRSMGFKSLDRACLDAIIKSRNFGPPPEDLLDNNRNFIMPMTFRIMGTE